MSWQIRHEGSPTATSGLTANQIVQGLTEGVWEVTDEVRGPNDKAWVPLESHPFFEEAVADYEPPFKKADDLEEHLDMNPLIDVALVLLIFFILTTSYDALRKVIDLPTVGTRNKEGTRVIDPGVAKAEFVRVQATVKDKNVVEYKVDDQVVEERHLQTAISVAMAQGRNKMIIDPGEGVSWGTICTIMDAGRGARVTKMMLQVKKD